MRHSLLLLPAAVLLAAGCSSGPDKGPVVVHPVTGKVLYDGRLQVMKHALGTHTAVSRVQGSRLKASREIRIATVFRDAPAEFLKMIVVHELAHLKEAEHNKAFYALCTHMTPGYHQLEFDLRLYLTHLESGQG